MKEITKKYYSTRDVSELTGIQMYELYDWNDADFIDYLGCIKKSTRGNRKYTLEQVEKYKVINFYKKSKRVEILKALEKVVKEK